MIFIYIILCIIAVFIVRSSSALYREAAIAIIENGRIIDDKTAQMFIDKLPIHWYTFKEMTEEEKEKEIKDLKEHYKLVLEVK
ncbi:MAG: hypothetical protein PUJ85_03300 [bacterium]|nr:hypothetical protein [bacterium]